mmetsp:Transcript_562/g.1293  ORF Transcript_562/g.1293 Transcript_562/m.1293 type:complete len:237 (-) Transcript_562:20-730(-)
MGDSSPSSSSSCMSVQLRQLSEGVGFLRAELVGVDVMDADVRLPSVAAPLMPGFFSSKCRDCRPSTRFNTFFCRAVAGSPCSSRSWLPAVRFSRGGGGRVPKLTLSLVGGRDDDAVKPLGLPGFCMCADCCASPHDSPGVRPAAVEHTPAKHAQPPPHSEGQGGWVHSALCLCARTHARQKLEAPRSRVGFQWRRGRVGGRVQIASRQAAEKCSGLLRPICCVPWLAGKGQSWAWC